MSSDLVSKSKLFSIAEPKGLGSINPLATINLLRPIIRPLTP